MGILNLLVYAILHILLFNPMQNFEGLASVYATTSPPPLSIAASSQFIFSHFHHLCKVHVSHRSRDSCLSLEMNSSEQ